MNEINTNPVILITGASGFLGRAVLGELASANALLSPGILRLFDRRPLSPDLQKLDLPLEMLTGDLRNPVEVEQACDGVDIVVHLASMVDWGDRKSVV